MPEPAPLRLAGVEKRFLGPTPIVALDGIDLEVAKGEIFGLLGPNGAGKSTTVGLCTTRVRPSAGTVEVLGIDAHTAPARVKRRIGVVTQSNTLDRSLDLWENLYYHCRYFGWSAGAARRRADEMLERARLADRRRSMPVAISGGMAQRLQVARAIAHRPDVLFLDEPTAGLDPQSRLALWELVEELRDDGITVVLTTHYMEEADALCDRVAIIDHGRILVCDTPERLKAAHGAAAVIEVTLRDDPDPAALAAVLADLRAIASVATVEAGAGRVRVMAASPEGLAAAVVSAVAPRLELADLTVTGSTLEAVFITLTGRDLRE